ncbi:BQ5605_C038g11715 [Microbotryum silenes-dioicae]|uniref:BQ5605_C038g11715 protein n=1 Tax=Microbotryum silenes-dioicae TaxID=796604 RepID=A0A2X0MIA4_9BASI|nr:BQ5605_C038g11715 [Microbotryum silenes-dioicae]
MSDRTGRVIGLANPVGGAGADFSTVLSWCYITHQELSRLLWHKGSPPSRTILDQLLVPRNLTFLFGFAFAAASTAMSSSTTSPPQDPASQAVHDHPNHENKEEGPKYPWTLAPPTYQQGLESRILTNLVPIFEPFFSTLQAPPHPTKKPARILELASGNGTHLLLYAQNFPPHSSKENLKEGTKLDGRSIIYQPTECDSFNCRLVDQKTQGVDLGRGKRIERCRRLDLLVEEDWEGLLADRTRDGTEVGGKSGEGWDLVLGHNFIHMVPWLVGSNLQADCSEVTALELTDRTSLLVLSPQGPTALFQRLKPQMRPYGKLLIYGPMKSDQGYFSENDEKVRSLSLSTLPEKDSTYSPSLSLTKFDIMIRSRPGSSGIGLRSIPHLGRLAEENGWTLEREIGVAMGNWVLVFSVNK